MISAFSKAFQVLNDPAYLKAATGAATFIRKELFKPESATLIRNYREGASDIDGFVDDYAFLVQGLLDRCEASFDIAWIEWAQQLQTTQDKLFYDNASAGYFSATGKDPSILLRLKEDYDGAGPSPNSISIMNLLRLAQITADEQHLAKAKTTLAHFSQAITD